MSPSSRQAPLFHPRLRKQIDARTFPPELARRHARLRRWIDSLRSGEIDDGEATEARLHGEILTHVFGDALGYRRLSAAGAGGWEIEPAKGLGTCGTAAAR